MAANNFLSIIFIKILKHFLSLKENISNYLGDVKNILIIRQHNQIGDVLVGFSLVRALKETYPEAKINILLGPQNKKGIDGNKYIDNHFVFDKKKLLSFDYFVSFIKFLRRNYDVCIVPATVSISFTSNLLSRLSKSRVRIGPNSLNGVPNVSNFLFDRRVDLDWRRYPDSHYADRILDLVRPFGISTNNFSIEIQTSKEDIQVAQNFIYSIKDDESQKVIGIHPGAGKPQNIWNLKKVVSLIEILITEFNFKVYLEGTDADKEELEYIKNISKVNLPEFNNKSIQQTAALIELSDLFITTDTGTMHIAASTRTPVISLFGPTNPYNWAPSGENKYFIRKSDFIDDIEVEDVIKLVKTILRDNEQFNK